MHLYDSELYMQDVCAVASMIEVQELADASVLISGGTGMIGSFLVDALLYADKHYQANTQVYICLLYTSPSPRDGLLSRMPSSA